MGACFGRRAARERHCRRIFRTCRTRRLAGALDRYKALGIWGADTRLPRSGYERLRAGLVSGGLVSMGTPYETAVDNALAERVISEDPPALSR